MSKSKKKIPIVKQKGNKKRYHRTIKKRLRQLVKSIRDSDVKDDEEIYMGEYEGFDLIPPITYIETIEDKLHDTKNIINDYDYCDYRFIVKDKKYLRK